MRLDKYLKVSRIIKRRTVSKDIISFGQVTLNKRVAKPSSEVKVDDIVGLTLGSKLITIKVLSINDKVKKEEAINLYQIISEEDIKEKQESN